MMGDIHTRRPINAHAYRSNYHTHITGDVLAHLADPVILHILSFLKAPELAPVLAAGTRWQALATR